MLLTVLKQVHRLDALSEILEAPDLDLRNVPTLVIDDEADQASLNTKIRKNDESTTYRCIRRLRRALPLHTYLQYTATPQAPLLINIACTLSPDFVYVLKPGSGYVGGQEFFAENSPYVRVIPAGEVFPDAAPPLAPPDSLLRAMRLFFVGLATALTARRDAGMVRRRSMLVHPSRATAVHAHFARWAKDIIQQWSDALDQPDHDRTKVETIADFAEAYQDLRATDQNLPAFDIVMAKMKRALNYTQVIEFNARDTPTTPKIEWRHAKGWLLVGGQAVDRGFTVADLTVTYMPRGLGLGNADAIQQRARFFGYKKRYLGQCRIFLTQDTAEAFQGYVGHEEAMRTELERLSKAKAEPLKEWDRRFILADELKPCRDTVLALGDEYVRGSVRSEWTQQKDATLSDEDRLFNAALVDAFLTRHEFVDDNWTFASTRKAQQHKVALEVPIGRVLDFLFEYHFPNALDTLQMTGLLLQLEHVQRWKKDATVMVYSMRPEFRSNTRGRRADADGLFIKGFLQGRTGEGSADGKYPGDAAFSAEDRVTLQLHRLRLLNQAGDLVDDTAPMIAARIPKDVAPNWIVRLEGGAT